MEEAKRRAGSDQIPGFQDPYATGKKAFTMPEQGRFDTSYGAPYPVPAVYNQAPHNPQNFTAGREPISGREDIRNEPPIPALDMEEIQRIQAQQAAKRLIAWGSREKNYGTRKTIQRSTGQIELG